MKDHVFMKDPKDGLKWVRIGFDCWYFSWFIYKVQEQIDTNQVPFFVYIFNLWVPNYDFQECCCSNSLWPYLHPSCCRWRCERAVCVCERWRHVTVETVCHTCVYGLGLGQGVVRAACGYCAAAMGCTPSSHKKRTSRDDQSSHQHHLINNSGNYVAGFCWFTKTSTTYLVCQENWRLIRWARDVVGKGKGLEWNEIGRWLGGGEGGDGLGMESECGWNGLVFNVCSTLVSEYEILLWFLLKSTEFYPILENVGMFYEYVW